ncbi:hypothetical protein BH23CHL1_BH23CHL1_27030 [soil metagenome]
MNEPVITRAPARRALRLGGANGILLRLGLIVLAATAVHEHVMRTSSLVVLLGFLLAGAILAEPLARYATAWLAFSLLRGIADDAGLPDRGGLFASADSWIGFGVTPTERLQNLLYTSGQLGIIDQAAIWIHASYYFVPHLIAIGIWWSCRKNGMQLFDTYLRATIAVMAAGVLLYVLLPTSPPWLESNGSSQLDVTRIVHAANSNPTVSREQIYTIFTDPNPIAAMPSLHTAITVLAAWALWRRNRPLGMLAAVYAMAMGLALVYLGEHYVIDVLAGAALTGIVVVIIQRRDVPVGRLLPPQTMHREGSYPPGSV